MGGGEGAAGIAVPGPLAGVGGPGWSPAVPTTTSQPAPASAHRDPHAAGGAVQVLRRLVGSETAAAPGPPGVFPPEAEIEPFEYSRSLEKLAERFSSKIRRKLPGAPVQVRRGSGSWAVGGNAGRGSSKSQDSLGADGGLLRPRVCR